MFLVSKFSLCLFIFEEFILKKFRLNKQSKALEKLSCYASFRYNMSNSRNEYRQMLYVNAMAEKELMKDVLVSESDYAEEEVMSDIIGKSFLII